MIFIEKMPRVDPNGDVCDFCGRKSHSLTPLRCRPFTVVWDYQESYADDGNWLGCPPCLTLIENGDVEGLVRRQEDFDAETAPYFEAQGRVRRYPVGDPRGREKQRRLVSAFLANRIE
jgi:hypothetical protein